MSCLFPCPFVWKSFSPAVLAFCLLIAVTLKATLKGWTTGQLTGDYLQASVAVNKFFLKKKMSWGYSSVIGHEVSIHKALSSIPASKQEGREGEREEGKRNEKRLGIVAHTCILGYLGGRSWEDHGLRLAQTESYQTLSQRVSWVWWLINEIIVLGQP
jgi:hypothetical protein